MARRLPALIALAALAACSGKSAGAYAEKACVEAGGLRQAGTIARLGRRLSDPALAHQVVTDATKAEAKDQRWTSLLDWARQNEESVRREGYRLAYDDSCFAAIAPRLPKRAFDPGATP